MNPDRPAMRWLRGLVGGVVLPLTVAAPAAGAQQSGGAVHQPAESADTRSVFVEIRDGLLTVKTQGAPVAAVLQAVALQANLKVVYRGDPTEQITVEFQDLALDEGVRQLLDNRSYALVYDREGDETGPARLVEIRVYPGAPPARRGLDQGVPTAQSGPDPVSRIQAMLRLSSLRGEETVATLAALLRQDPDASIRREAARGLARIGGPMVVSALERGLTDPETMVRWEIVRALRRTGDEAAVASLTQAFFTDQDPRIRRTAARALIRLGGASSRDVLRRALEADPDPSVREEVGGAQQRWERTHGKERP